MKRALAIAASISALIDSAAGAPAFAPRPAVPDPAPITPPVIDTWTLDNGMRVTTARLGTVPMVRVRLVVHAGRAAEGAVPTGLADLAAAMMIAGTRDRSGAALARDVADMGGELRAEAALDALYVEADVLSPHVAVLIPLIASVAREPTLSNEAFDAAVREVGLRAAVLGARSGELALATLHQRLFGKHPYGTPLVSPERVAASTPERVREFHSRHVSPVGAHLYVVGQFNQRAIRRAVEAAFGDWRAGSSPGTAPSVDRAAAGLVVVDRSSAQATIVLGARVPGPAHPDWAALQVANAIFGATPSARVTRNLRERLGYSYRPQSELRPYRVSTVWTQTAEVPTGAAGVALAELERELGRLRTELASPDEVAAAVAYLAGRHAIELSRREGVLAALRQLDLRGLEHRRLADYVEYLREVDATDVRRVARKYLSTSSLVTVIVGDAAALQPQLERAHRSATYGRPTPITER